MHQNGLVVNASQPVDEMKYTYANSGYSNQLLSVKDSISQDNKLGDFTDGNTSGDDYAYDANGNLIKDLNKGITSIQYNYLNLPETIDVIKTTDHTNKGMIKYVYDAAGNKLQKIVTDSTTSPINIDTTTYIGGFIYKDDTLQYIAHEEGRIRPKLITAATGYTPSNINWIYDYYEKDHLGDIRLTLTEEKDTAIYKTGMENSLVGFEEQLFNNIAATRDSLPSAIRTYANTFGGRLNSSEASRKVGPAITLKVMAGDQFDVKTFYYYSDPVTGTNNNHLPVNSLVQTIADAFFGAGSVQNVGDGKFTNTQLSNASFTGNTAFQDWVRNDSTASGTNQSGKPKAYLNYVLFDDQFNFISASALQVQTTNAYTALAATGINVTKNGYLYIFVSNEASLNVFFDSLQVNHRTGPILEEDHYYSAGLIMAGISDRAALKPGNRYKYNGYELNKDFDINLYETFYRSHDPQLGRFWQVDPKPDESVSLYAAMANNPLRYSDPLGDTIIFTQTFLKTKYGKQLMALYKGSATFRKLLSQYDIGGKGGFWGDGEKGEYADNTNIVFDVFDNKSSGGGETGMQVQNQKGDWVDAGTVNPDEINKDSKTRINVFVNPNMRASNNLQKFANIVTHELTVHGTGFMDMSNILHSNSASDFITYRNAGNYINYGSPTRNDILRNGYYQPNVQHAIVGMGLNGYYNAIRNELNTALSKQGNSALPNDAKSYRGEVDRVKAAFQNINQITQLGIYGPH